MSVGVGTFDATLTAMKLTKSNGGTPGVWMKFDVGTDALTETRWITHKTKDRIEKELATFGFTKEQIRDKGFWSDPLKYVSRDPECSIVTEEEKDDKGKARIRVKWINHRVAPATEADVNTVIGLFGSAADEDPFAGIPPNTEDPFGV